MDTNSNKRMFDIVGGPSKSALFDACRYAFDRAVKFPVDFKVAFGYTMPIGHEGAAVIYMVIEEMKIASIEHEDGSGEKFNISGFCKADLDHIHGKEMEPYKFEAFYNTRTRNGKMSFTSH